MTDLLGGSHFSLGLLFEVILNCFPSSESHKGRIYEMSI
jgi:hypothetical protein